MTQLTKQHSVDLLLLIAEHEWEAAGLHDPTSPIYEEILAADLPELLSLTHHRSEAVVRFTLKHTALQTVAARVPTGLVGTALIARGLLEELRPLIVAQVGFGGILSDDLRLGDVAIASQVDCYLTKNKAVGSRSAGADDVGSGIAFAGEVFRPTHGLIQLAVNLKYAHPEVYAEFQNGVRRSTNRLALMQDPEHPARRHLRVANGTPPGAELSWIHAVHFACAEIVSTTSAAVRWLRSRDRKLAVIDMESGGLMGAIWEYSHRHAQQLETLILRGGGGYGDERHEQLIKPHAPEIHRLAFENACRFLCCLLHARFTPVQSDACPLAADVGIVVPLEEEFGYFMELLYSLLPAASVRPVYRAGRYYYLFEIGRLTCAATFVGDMGLVRMALATEDLRQAFNPSALVLLGIAAGFSGPMRDVKICDVVVAESVDLYLHRAHNRMGSNHTKTTVLRDEPPIPTSNELTEFATRDARFAGAREAWARSCEHALAALLEASQRDGVTIEAHRLGVATIPTLQGVRLASGEFVAAAREFVDELKARGCSAADMEAGGAAVAYQRMCADRAGQPTPKLLILRGISDLGDEDKAVVEAAGHPNLFRRACLHNASRLLVSLLDNEDFASLIAPTVALRQGPPGQES